jgi:hypothetical protein
VLWNFEFCYCLRTSNDFNDKRCTHFPLWISISLNLSN